MANKRYVCCFNRDTECTINKVHHIVLAWSKLRIHHIVLAWSKLRTLQIFIVKCTFRLNRFRAKYCGFFLQVCIIFLLTTTPVGSGSERLCLVWW